MPTTTAEAYLASLPEARRQIIATMRELILVNLPTGYVESVNWGMLSYEVPLATYPNTYNKKPLTYIGLAAQKRSNSLYLMAIYQNPHDYQELLNAYTRLGLKPDLGKSCLRFNRLDQLPLDTIAHLISKVSVENFIQAYENSRSHKPKN